MFAQYKYTNSRYSATKDSLQLAKSDNIQLMAEKVDFETRVGLLGNTDMLRDFKITEGKLQEQIKRNEDTRRRLGWWWEGFKKSGGNI